MTFPAPVIAKPIVAEWNYTEIFWTKFYPNMQRNVENTNKVSFVPYVLLSLYQF